MDNFLKEVRQELDEKINQKIREKIVNNIVERMVADFREEAEAVVKEEVKNLSIKYLNWYREILIASDVLEMRCYWNDELINKKRAVWDI